MFRFLARAFTLFVLCLIPLSSAQAYKYTPDLPDSSVWKDYDWKYSFNSVTEWVSSGVIINKETGYGYELVRTGAIHVPGLLEHAAAQTWDYQGKTLQAELASVTSPTLQSWLVNTFGYWSANGKEKNALAPADRWDMSRSNVIDPAFANRSWDLNETLTGGYFDLASGQKAWEAGDTWQYEGPWYGNNTPTPGAGNYWLAFLGYEGKWAWTDETCLAGYLVQYKLPSATPIPAALPLLGAGLAGIAFVRRRMATV